MKFFLKKIKKYKWVSAMLFLVFFYYHTINAAYYQLLESLPSENQTLVSPSLADYLGWIFSFALAIAGFLAVLMITVGGITYMASGGNESQITKAKGYITNALWGLLLAFGAYLLLYTINPQLVSFDFLNN